MIKNGVGFGFLIVLLSLSGCLNSLKSVSDELKSSINLSPTQNAIQVAEVTANAGVFVDLAGLASNYFLHSNDDSNVAVSLGTGATENRFVAVGASRAYQERSAETGMGDEDGETVLFGDTVSGNVFRADSPSANPIGTFVSHHKTPQGGSLQYTEAQIGTKLIRSYAEASSANGICRVFIKSELQSTTLNGTQELSLTCNTAQGLFTVVSWKMTLKGDFNADGTADTLVGKYESTLGALVIRNSSDGILYQYFLVLTPANLGSNGIILGTNLSQLGGTTTIE